MFDFEFDEQSDILSPLSWPDSLIVVLAENDCHDSLHYWVPEKNKPKYGINCSDWFYWACADAQEITPEDLPDLIKAIEDSTKLHPFEFYGPLLWTCRKRNMRPMKEVYRDMPEELHELFNKTGPKRES